MGVFLAREVATVIWATPTVPRQTKEKIEPRNPTFSVTLTTTNAKWLLVDAIKHGLKPLPNCTSFGQRIINSSQTKTDIAKNKNVPMGLRKARLIDAVATIRSAY